MVLATLEAGGCTLDGVVTGLLAVLEVVGLLVALFLARGASGDSSWRHGLSEVIRGRSIALLIAGIVIGAVVGPERLAPTDPLFLGLFTGALTLFLLEMGTAAAHSLRDVAKAGIRVELLAMAISVVNGLLGVLAGSAAGLSTGGTAVLATLAASASYIAAPAAVRVALPQASPDLYVTASLGITFPFNVIIGIPLYIAMAERPPSGSMETVQRQLVTNVAEPLWRTGS